MNMLILVVDDEPDVEVLFRQQFRRDLRNDRFTMEFAQSAPMALQRITDIGDRSLILILSAVYYFTSAAASEAFRPDNSGRDRLAKGIASWVFGLRERPVKRSLVSAPPLVLPKNLRRS